jgi:peptidyl-prolyl cis-trans isomerase C
MIIDRLPGEALKGRTMNSRFRTAIGCVALAAAPVLAQQPVLPKPGTPAAQPQAAARTATVNGKTIPKSRVDAVVKQQTARGAPDNDQLRQAVVDRLVNFELVVQEADRKGLTKSPDVQAQIDIARQQVIFEAYMQDHFKAKPVSDNAMRTEYNRIKAQRGDKEYKARHVLVENEAEAKDIIAKLSKGAKFEDLAKQSKDPGSRDRGGDLNWNPPTTFVKPFADAMVKLEKGKHTEQPVRSQFGWHVIRLDDVRPVQFPSYEQVKPQIQNMIQEQEVQKVFSELRAKAKIE